MLRNVWKTAPWNVFDEFDRLQREMNRVFNRASGTGSTWDFPAVNVYSSDDDVVLTAELPGVDTDDLDVSVKNDTVTLRGERKLEKPGENEQVLRRERGSGTFVRSFAVPFNVDSEKVSAEYKRGILVVKLPRSAEDKGRKIKVLPE